MLRTSLIIFGALALAALAAVTGSVAHTHHVAAGIGVVTGHHTLSSSA
jgi:hypothetical protein